MTAIEMREPNVTTYKCRHCHSPLEHVFLDLGHQPPSNAYLSAEQLLQPEIYYPLKLYVCDQCWLVQVPEHASAGELFDANYAYFSSVSKSWVEHADNYVSMIRQRLGLSGQSFVVEIAANDGYLLQFMQAAGIPCLGIEPTASTAAAARAKGINIREEFFGEMLAEQMARVGEQADLIIGNNVLAHVPDINDFVVGLKGLLKPGGTITLEFPHLLKLIQQVQFDTVYHEHFSYLSLSAVCRIFLKAGLEIFDVEELPTHGGSLRIYAQHPEAPAETVSPRVQTLLQAEQDFGLQSLATYQGFQAAVNVLKNNFLDFLLKVKREGKSIAAYGAAAKGNTLLNYAGVKPDLLPFVCDAAPSKQGKYLPGSHIPIYSPEEISAIKPDYVLVLPWNLRLELEKQLYFIRDWEGELVTVIPTLEKTFTQQ
jgi:SAM-dependent methyltransferase